VLPGKLIPSRSNTEIELRIPEVACQSVRETAVCGWTLAGTDRAEADAMAGIRSLDVTPCMQYTEAVVAGRPAQCYAAVISWLSDGHSSTTKLSRLDTTIMSLSVEDRYNSSKQSTRRGYFGYLWRLDIGPRKQTIKPLLNCQLIVLNRRTTNDARSFLAS